MRKFVLLLGCFAASPLAAGEAKLSGEAIKTTLGGSHLELDTPVGTTVSVRIGHDGLMSGEAGTALGAVLGAAKDRGRWWVFNDQVCFKWFRWFDAEERCATISVEGKHLTWRRNDGDTGTATIVEQDRPAVIMAQTSTKAEEQTDRRPAKKPEVAVVAGTHAPESPSAVAETAPVPQTQPEAAPAPRSIPSPPGVEPTTVALRVPAPHPASRPRPRPEKVAVTSVKPQFFAATKLRVAKAEAPKTARKPFRVAGVDPSDVLNIRNGPSPDYESVGGIPPDSRGITITGPCQNDWCPVKHRTLVGWVNRKYLTEETAANTTSAAELNYWDPAP